MARVRETHKNCQWCGKVFECASNNHPRFCSDECRKAHLREYQKIFHRKLRASRDEAEKQAEKDRANGGYARKVWENWGKEADKVIALANSNNPRDTLTKYLYDTYRFKRKNAQARGFETIKEASEADQIIAKILKKD